MYGDKSGGVDEQREIEYRRGDFCFLLWLGVFHLLEGWQHLLIKNS